MGSGYFDEDIIKTIETLGCKYFIKGKAYPTLLAKLTGVYHLFVKGQEGRETTEFFTKLNNWDTDRRFVISRVLKPEQDRVQMSLVEGDECE